MKRAKIKDGRPRVETINGKKFCLECGKLKKLNWFQRYEQIKNGRLYGPYYKSYCKTCMVDYVRKNNLLKK